MSHQYVINICHQYNLKGRLMVKARAVCNLSRQRFCCVLKLEEVTMTNWDHV